MKQKDFKNNQRIQQSYKTRRVDTTLYPTFRFIFDFLFTSCVREWLLMTLIT